MVRTARPDRWEGKGDGVNVDPFTLSLSKGRSAIIPVVACGASTTPGQVRERTGLEHGSMNKASGRSEEHTSEIQSLMRISYAVFCLKKKIKKYKKTIHSDSTYMTIYKR